MKQLFFYLLLFLCLQAPAMAQSNDIATEEDRPENIPDSATRAELVASASIYLDCPYKYASYQPEAGFDCSGFVYFLYQQIGIAPPRSSREYQQLNSRVKLKKIAPGDVLVFKGRQANKAVPGHVGIVVYADEKEVSFIHASTSRGVIVSKLSEPYYDRRFLYAIDLLGKGE